MARPSKLPEWATSGSIVEPVQAKKELGFVLEKPPFQWFNYQWNLLYDWTVYFDDFVTPMVNNSVSGSDGGIVTDRVQGFSDATTVYFGNSGVIGVSIISDGANNTLDNVDEIGARDAGAGLEIESVNFKAGAITMDATKILKTDRIEPVGPSLTVATVTFNSGNILCNGMSAGVSVSSDVIQNYSSGAGITLNGSFLGTGDITLNAQNIDINNSGGAITLDRITIASGTFITQTAGTGPITIEQVAIEDGAIDATSITNSLGALSVEGITISGTTINSCSTINNTSGDVLIENVTVSGQYITASGISGIGVTMDCHGVTMTTVGSNVKVSGTTTLVTVQGGTNNGVGDWSEADLYTLFGGLASAGEYLQATGRIKDTGTSAELTISQIQQATNQILIWGFNTATGNQESFTCLSTGGTDNFRGSISVA